MEANCRNFFYKIGDKSCVSFLKITQKWSKL